MSGHCLSPSSQARLCESPSQAPSLQGGWRRLGTFTTPAGSQTLCLPACRKLSQSDTFSAPPGLPEGKLCSHAALVNYLNGRFESDFRPAK